MTTLTDESLMPFGKYKGIFLKEVPASYLLWLGESVSHIAPNKRSLAQKHLAEYIDDNKEVLMKENK